MSGHRDALPRALRAQRRVLDGLDVDATLTRERVQFLTGRRAEVRGGAPRSHLLTLLVEYVRLTDVGMPRHAALGWLYVASAKRPGIDDVPPLGLVAEQWDRRTESGSRPGRAHLGWLFHAAGLGVDEAEALWGGGVGDLSSAVALARLRGHDLPDPLWPPPPPRRPKRGSA